jgi:hypothetical protein
MMVGAATVFVVTDIAKITEHYRDVLSFTVTFRMRKSDILGSRRQTDPGERATVLAFLVSMRI